MAAKNEKNSVLKTCLANAQNLSNLVEYAADSIVSKTILDKSEGTITLFAFDKGQKLSEHTAPYDAVIQVIEGKSEIRIDNKDHEVSEGEIIIMPADIPHAVAADENFKMLLIMIRS
jgi:quercetin dioxygenase-like cupin family protein